MVDGCLICSMAPTSLSQQYIWFPALPGRISGYKSQPEPQTTNNHGALAKSLFTVSTHPPPANGGSIERPSPRDHAGGDNWHNLTDKIGRQQLGVKLARNGLCHFLHGSTLKTRLSFTHHILPRFPHKYS